MRAKRTIAGAALATLAFAACSKDSAPDPRADHVARCVAAQVEAYQSIYGTKARPSAGSMDRINSLCESDPSDGGQVP